MDAIKRWLIEWEVTYMLNKLMNAIEGKKTYILALVGALTAVVAHFWGPITIGGTSIPQTSAADMWKAIWAVASLASLRHGISTSGSGQ